MILVTAATGNVGREVLSHLIAAGEDVRILTRDVAHAARVLPGDVETIAGNLVTGEGLATALDRVDGVFLFLDATRLPSGAAGPAARIIAEHGRPRVVALSSASAAGEPGNIIAGGHLTAEAALAEAGLQATILRPGEFMTNALGWADAVRAGAPVLVPFLDHPSAPVDPVDIAAVTATILRSAAYQSRVIPISGGEYTTPRERVATLGKVLGKPLVAEEISQEEYVAGMARFMPPAIVEAVLDLQRQERERGGVAADWLWPAIREITGRAPRTFADWARANRRAFD